MHLKCNNDAPLANETKKYHMVCGENRHKKYACKRKVIFT